MVSTRGGARTSGTDDAETMLRKKPVRRATAKTKAPAASTTTKSTASKAKTTRSKKAEPEPEPAPEEVEDDTEDELQEDTPAPVKATRKPATRAKNAEEPPKSAKAAPTRKAAAKAKAPIRTARATATRTTRAKASDENVDDIAEESAEEQSEPPKPVKPAPKPTAKSSATRATRATAAKDKANPLLPKKITQVSKAPAKTTKAAGAKTAPSTAKSAPAKSTTRGRPPGRRRNVSDENAYIPHLAPPAEQEQDEIEVKKAAGKAKRIAQRPQSPVVVEDDIIVCTRRSTPAESVKQSHDDDEDHDMDAEQQDSAGEEEDDMSEQSSQDELSGPKSPMKRLSPVQAKKCSPAKKSMLPDIGVPMTTPVRRFAVLGTQQGTPQTEKPYCKPAVPMIAGEPLTVARAQSRAMVFPRLQPLDQKGVDTEVSEENTHLSDESTPVPQEQDHDVHMSDAEPEQEQDPDLSLLVDPENRTSDIDDDLTLDTVEASAPPKETPSEVEQHQQSLQKENLGDALVSTDDVEAETANANDDSFGSVDSVIITRPTLGVEDDVDDSVEDSELSSATPRPETLIWENIREDVTIPFNFDGNASPSRVLAQREPEVIDDAAVSNAYETSRLSTLGQSGRESTVRLSEFVDIASLAGTKQSLEAQVEAVAEYTVAPTTVEDFDEEEESIVEGEVTMYCPEPATPHTVKRSPIRLTTVEHVDEDEASMEGDVTLLLEHKEGPLSTRRSPVKLATVEHVDDEEMAVDGEMSLLLEQLETFPNPQLSPVKLSMVEDHPEEDDAVAGDVTLALQDLSPSPELPATPVLVNDARESDVTSIDLQEASLEQTPHYARPTFASRRKSISSHQSAEFGGDDSRPKTPESSTTPSGGAWFDMVRSPARRSTSRSRPGTAANNRSASRPRTPAGTTPVPKSTRSSVFGSAVPAARERMPGLPSANTYEELLGSPAGKNSARSSPNISQAVAGAEERYPGLPSRQTYEDLNNSPKVGTSPTTDSVPAQETPTTSSRRLRRQPRNVMVSTPQPAERFPGLPAKRSYEEHAKTAQPATRFATPDRRYPVRATTARKPLTLRKMAITQSRTPMKTPLKAPGETPAQVQMTPHPNLPLRGIVALVDVYTSDGGCATGPFSQLLQRLGAKTTKTFSDRVTHVVFKDGHPKLLQTLVIHNKQIADSGSGQQVFCVNSRWVNDCDANGTRMSELDEEYAVDIDDAPRTAKRRRKSMEPMSLLNNGGNIVRDRKSSLGRVSIGRLSSKTFDLHSDLSQMSPKVDIADKENSEEGGEAGSSPATPAYLAAPDSLVQQTAPMNRVRKLDLKAQDQARRLTFTNMEF